ncbi:MAG: hypothetical protein ACJ78Q_03135 [Chloroflexia bacterium]
MHSDLTGNGRHLSNPTPASGQSTVSTEGCTFLSLALSQTIDVYMGGLEKPSLKLRTTDIFADLGWTWDKVRAERIIDELEKVGAIEVAVRTSAVCSFYVCAKGAELVAEGWDGNHP